jgi:hypothetical protein
VAHCKLQNETILGTSHSYNIACFQRLFPYLALFKAHNAHNDLTTNTVNSNQIRNILVYEGINVKLCLCLTKHHTMKMYGYGGIIHAFLTSALDGGEWSASHPSCFIPLGKSPQYQLERRLGVPQGQFGCSGKGKKSHHCPCWESNPSHPACSLVSSM